MILIIHVKVTGIESKIQRERERDWLNLIEPSKISSDRVSHIGRVFSYDKFNVCFSSLKRKLLALRETIFGVLIVSCKQFIGNFLVNWCAKTVTISIINVRSSR